MKETSKHKHSYTVTCGTAFRDAVEALAARRKVNVGDLARSVMLVVSEEEISQFPDPGEPPNNDREAVIIKSGPAEGRPWRRKPRLQVRMAPGFSVSFVRKALAMALAAERGEIVVRVENSKTPKFDPHLQEELERLRAIIGALSFDPLPDGVRSREEALHILGFPPTSRPDERTLRAKFRMLATIHHPDSSHGDHRRMSQLNAAIDILRRAAA
jgi:hypothetical protein